MHHQWSIVMLAMNSKSRTISSIASVRRAIRNTDSNIEFIVVDNGSTDGLSKWLMRQDDICTISNAENVGVPRARNMAMNESAGDVVLFLDNDVELRSNALLLLDRKMTRTDIGMAGDAGSVFVPEWARNEMVSHDMTDECFPGVNFIVGYCMAIKRSVFDEVGPFDEDYPLYYWEDIDYGIRVRKAGYSLGVVSNICFHYGHLTVSDISRDNEVERVQRTGRLRTLSKHHKDCPVWVLATSTSGEPQCMDVLDDKLSSTRPNIITHVITPGLTVSDRLPWRVCFVAEKYPRGMYTRVCVWDGASWDMGDYTEPEYDDEIKALNDPLTRKAW